MENTNEQIKAVLTAIDDIRKNPNIENLGKMNGLLKQQGISNTDDMLEFYKTITIDNDRVNDMKRTIENLFITHGHFLIAQLVRKLKIESADVLNKGNEELSVKIADLKQQIVANEATIAELKQQINELVSKGQETGTEIERLKTELSQAKENHSNLVEKHAALQAELEKKQTEYNGLIQYIKFIESKLQTLATLSETDLKSLSTELNLRTTSSSGGSYKRAFAKNQVNKVLYKANKHIYLINKKLLEGKF